MSVGEFEMRGGARIGWFNATVPLARIKANAAHLELKVSAGCGVYTWSPSQVIALRAHSPFGWFGRGIIIEHSNRSYPRKIIFWTRENPQEAIDGIQRAGFKPASNISTEEAFRDRRGPPLRWSVIVLALLLWNGLFFLQPISAWFTLAPLALFFAATLGAFAWPEFRKMILKPGRDFAEVQSFFGLARLVLGLLLVTFTIVLILDPKFRQQIENHSTGKPWWHSQ